ncbi:MAG: hypothetical protein LKJ44_05070 [Bifidobacteriaceae bacterium]|jgi:hypothetical protein|nr:hypothetical protein [Bifidobacteriaceae bacterium]MCI1979069.1 hypothetical protein [Bifidobacteriaceae bacterium]
MSGLGDVPFRRVTVEYLKKNLAARVDEPYANLVTLTSIATDLEEVGPGALYVPPEEQQNVESLRSAESKGAYAVLLPENDETHTFSVKTLGIPVLFARNIEKSLGTVASYMEGDPSDSLAIFVVFGDEAQQVAAKLATLLHILGNPVGLISQERSYSLNRGMNFKFPLNAAQVQRAQSVILEDGAAALVIAADDDTLASDALVGTRIDVCGSHDETISPSYGADFDQETHIVKPGMFDGELARLGTLMPMTDRVSAMSISMALAAGITIESIQQAVEVSEEFS